MAHQDNRAAKARPVVLAAGVVTALPVLRVLTTAMAAEAVTAGMASLAVEEVAEAGAVLQRRAAGKERPAQAVLAVRSTAAEVRAAARVPAGTRSRSLA